ncbi:McrB family protein [Bacteroides sp.]|uniref:McrB family protein n=1 Tax=Bacteroides sp. TaxID=29523 RepID=UPI004024C9F7
MTNKSYQKEFSEWLLNVIPSSYFNWINANNIDSKLEDIKILFKESFGVNNVFEVDVNDITSYSEQLKNYCSNKSETPFAKYSEKALSGVPNAIINKYFICYINALNKNVGFKSADELIRLINEKLGHSWCDKFQEKRKKLLGKARSATKGQLFKIENRNNWFINEGGGCEIQYHCAFYPDEQRVIYGLGFNTQYVPFVNDIMPHITPYMNAYLNKKNECLKSMYNCTYLWGNEEQLINPQRDQYNLLGKEINVFDDKKDEDNDDFSYFIKEIDFEMLIYNLKEWLNPYEIIIQERNRLIETANIKSQMSNTIQQILESKKQIILQGAPGTGKTYKTAELAVAICDGKFTDFSNRSVVMNRYNELKTEGRIAFTTFHQSMDYEEFVEGLKPVNTSNGVIFEPKAGLFKEICDSALLANITLTQNISQKVEFEDAFDYLLEQITASDTFTLPTKTNQDITLTRTLNNNIQFRHNGATKKYTVSRDRLLRVYNKYNNSDLVNNISNISNAMREIIGGCNASGYWAVLKYIVDHKNVTEDDVTDIENLSEKDKESAIQTYINSSKEDRGSIKGQNYVLIIDEINRGNISKILGELITLLEADKRIGEQNELTAQLPYSQKEFGIPSNLYIIGTMNTADRSIGYIDYAIRRRFGFVSIKSDFNVIADQLSDVVKPIADMLYKSVEKLMEQVSPEFNAEDLMIGHSYFIAKDVSELEMKLEYEIKPLLREYANDGILNLQKDSKTKKYTSIEELSINNQQPSDAK